MLTCLLKGIELAVKEKIVSDEVFSKECFLPFGRDLEEVPCYAFKLSALTDAFHSYKPFSMQKANIQGKARGQSSCSFRFSSSYASSDFGFEEEEETKVEAEMDLEDLGILEAVQLNVPGYTFPYSMEVLEMALKEYNGPYGRSVWFPAHFRFEGEPDDCAMMPEEFFQDRYSQLVQEALEQAKKVDMKPTRQVLLDRILLRQKKPVELAPEVLALLKKQSYSFPEVNEDRKVVIIAQVLYTAEEKTRRAAEEQATATLVAQRIEEFQTWISSSFGVKELRAVVESRIAKQRESLEVAQREHKEALKEYEITKKGYELHKDPNREQSTPEDDDRFAEFKQAQQALKEAAEELDSEKKYRRKRYAWCEQNTLRLAELFLKKELETALLEIARRIAFSKRVRRPWDGEGFGRDFEVWKVEWQRTHLESSAEFGMGEELSLLEQGAMVKVHFGNIMQDVEDTTFEEAELLFRKDQNNR